MVRIPGFHCCGPGSIPARGTEITLALQCYLKKKKKRLSWQPGGWDSMLQCRGHGFNPWLGMGILPVVWLRQKTKPKVIISQCRVPCWVWLLSLSKKIWDLRFTHLVELYQLLVLCPCWRISIHWLEGPQIIIYLLVEGHLDCFQFGVVKNKASVTITSGRGAGVGALFFCLPLQGEIYLFSH